MTSRKRIIPPASAEAFTVQKGQILRIVDLVGGQPGDLVAFHLHDLEEAFSQARTRVENRAFRVTLDHTLWTDAAWPRVMFTVAADTGGGHDLLYTPCCRYALERRFGVSRDGCLENLARALAPHRARRVPDPLNLFFNVHTDPAGPMHIGAPLSGPGDRIDLRAEMDCLVAVATCAAPKATPSTGYEIEILEDF
ncbi:MAG: urea carboxylase-associated family protein [Candidatus Latescibacteria bacterium]|nr:urea carboxylase-associated family protein [Candidatus Latescibacterota bacterium]